jgi:hypothetical protein
MELRSLPARPPARRRPRRPRWLGRIAVGGLSLTAVTGLAAGAAIRVRPALTPSLPAAPVHAATPTTVRMVDYVDGVFRNDAGRWQVGAAGDVVAVGDWDCDGKETLALLRPSTGALYAFLSWAGGARDETADALGVVEGATSIETTDVDDDGCDELVVRRAVGEPITLHPPDHL